jgi:hypothetical protein
LVVRRTCRTQLALRITYLIGDWKADRNALAVNPPVTKQAKRFTTPRCSRTRLWFPSFEDALKLYAGKRASFPWAIAFQIADEEGSKESVGSVGFFHFAAQGDF